MRTKHEKYEIAEISREQINPAKYNPRIIDGENRKALEKGLKRHGFVEPLVWNKRTGNLVSGHQRISVLDKLERGTDYDLTVSVIDVDETEEATLNVQLNNKSMQGDFDFEKLGNLALDLDIDLSDMGFSDFDVSMMFNGDERFTDLFRDEKSVEATKDEIRDIRENRAGMKENYDKEQNADFYIVVVCKDQKDKDALLRDMSVPNYEKFVTSETLNRLRR
jgi:hypothetical protein